jgi:hypothetical protein
MIRYGAVRHKRFSGTLDQAIIMVMKALDYPYKYPYSLPNSS